MKQSLEDPGAVSKKTFERFSEGIFIEGIPGGVIHPRISRRAFGRNPKKFLKMFL